MFNITKKLSKEDLEELRKFTELVNQYVMIANGLEIQKQAYIKGILSKYGCDLNKNYEINIKTGQIKLAKESPQK